jgi:hypothetical protein
MVRFVVSHPFHKEREMDGHGASYTIREAVLQFIAGGSIKSGAANEGSAALFHLLRNRFTNLAIRLPGGFSVSLL